MKRFCLKDADDDQKRVIIPFNAAPSSPAFCSQWQICTVAVFTVFWYGFFLYLEAAEQIREQNFVYCYNMKL